MMKDLIPWAGRWVRIVSSSIRDFIAHQCSLRASSLTYHTVLAVVPVAAVFFSLARKIGLEGRVQSILLERFDEQHEALVQIFSLSQNVWKGLRGGVFAGLGIVLIVWSVFRVFSHLEISMNQIWDVEKRRSWKRMLSDFVVLMIVCPLLFFLTNAWIRMGFFSSLLLFILIYLAVPNGKIPVRSAFIGGVVGSGLYWIGKWLYIHLQIGVDNYGAIYGSLAALPLFLMWVRLSWYIFLFGAEVGHAHQIATTNE